MPERTAIITPDGAIDYAALDALANQVANGLVAVGIGVGRKAAILGTNRLDYAAIYFGAARAGCILAHLNVRSTADDIVYMLTKTEVEIVFVEAAYGQPGRGGARAAAAPAPGRRPSPARRRAARSRSRSSPATSRRAHPPSRSTRRRPTPSPSPAAPRAFPRAWSAATAHGT